MRYVLILITINMLLFSCSSTTSFEGKLLENKKVHLLVDCSDEVNRGENNVKDLGYVCKVVVTDKTVFLNENSEKMNSEQLQKGTNLKIVLFGPSKISKNVESREVEAKEIHMLTD
jgi:hypothetical protein